LDFTLLVLGANDWWYRWLRSAPDGGFKARLVELVEWHAEKPKLRTCEAYDLAYDIINCRTAGGMRASHLKRLWV
jgi:hypothetical protein